MIDAQDTALVLEGGGMRNSYTAACIVKLLAEDMQVKSTERSVAKLRANYEAGAAQIHHEWPAWREFLS